MSDYKFDPSKACISATWNVELNTYCPGCKELVNLLEDADFWDKRKLDICEHDTERSKVVDVMCPECAEEFEVCCEY